MGGVTMTARKSPSLQDLAPAFMSWPVPAFEEVRPDPTTGALEFEIWQDGRCGACGVHQNDTSKRHAIDHDHNTGLVRGLLCTGCNLQEGWQPNYTFKLWRGGVNPCTLFGWHYEWTGPRAQPKAIRTEDAERLVRYAAIREEARQVELAEAMEKMRADGTGFFGTAFAGLTASPVEREQATS